VGITETSFDILYFFWGKEVKTVPHQHATQTQTTVCKMVNLIQISIYLCYMMGFHLTEGRENARQNRQTERRALDTNSGDTNANIRYHMVLPIHEIPDGYVGVVHRGGKMRADIVESPGEHYHQRGMFLYSTDEITAVHVEVQTDTVYNIKCKESITFNVEIENHLQNRHGCVLHTISKYKQNYDRKLIHEFIDREMRRICKTYSPDEVIHSTQFDTIDEQLAIALREHIQSYDGPVGIQSRTGQTGMGNCLLIKGVKTSQAILEEGLRTTVQETAKESQVAALKLQKQTTQSIEQETLRKTASATAALNLETAESDAKKQKIEDEMAANTARSLAETNFFIKQKEADGIKAEREAYGNDLLFIKARAISAHESAVGSRETNTVILSGNNGDSYTEALYGLGQLLNTAKTQPSSASDDDGQTNPTCPNP
jgi:hypothetical protein